GSSSTFGSGRSQAIQTDLLRKLIEVSRLRTAFSGPPEFEVYATLSRQRKTRRRVDSDVAGSKILAYSRVSSVAAVRSLRRAVWYIIRLALDQAWINAIVITCITFGFWPSGDYPVRSSIILTAPRTRR